MKMIYINADDLGNVVDKQTYGDGWINSSHISKIKVNPFGKLIIYYEDDRILIHGEKTIKRIKNELNLVVEGEDA